MKLEQSFDVAAPVDRVWRALIDVEQVAPCLPGAAVTGRNDDGSYNGTFSVKIGPTTASYTGRLEMEQVDEAPHTATMQAQGSDKRGQGGANGDDRLTRRVARPRPDPREVDTDYHITGRLARFGRGGMIEDISERLLREFAARLQFARWRGAARPGGCRGRGPGEPATEVRGRRGRRRCADRRGRAAGGRAAPSPSPHRGRRRPRHRHHPPAAGRAATPAPARSRVGTSRAEGARGCVGRVVLDRIRANPSPVIGAAVLLLLIRRRRRRRKRAVLKPRTPLYVLPSRKIVSMRI